jgi:hypothetical protein
MLPIFPAFKKICLDDEVSIKEITQRFAPYSDFNFTSLWAWNTKDCIELAVLNHNLVVKFTDYITQEPFYSFIGTNNVDQTAEKLIEQAISENITPTLKLIPQDTADLMSKEIFKIEEDIDGFDYVYEMDKLRSYDGNKLRSKRNLYNRFIKSHNLFEIKILDTLSPIIQKEIMMLFELWAKNKGSAPEETENEKKAFKRVLQLKNLNNMVSIGLYIDNKLVGLIVNEILESEYTILHFEKADESYVGIYSYIMAENAKILCNMHRRRYLNYEQDLGLPGLRLGKKSFRPCHYLKKFKASLR